MSQLIQSLEKRFLRYVKIDTQSNEHNSTIPSTAKQYDLLNLLVEELNAIGASDVTLTDYASVIATLPATTDKAAPTLAFLAHVDTSQDFSGTNVKPIVHRNYDGSPILLPDDPSRIIDPVQFPYLKQKVGEDVVTASGNTLLGADDKAGVAIVMTLVEHLLANPEIPHGPIRICFTPDEEIGRGVHSDLPKDLQADFAWTLDGGNVGEIVYETFSADKATISIKGFSIHPGYAKGKMVSAIHLAAKLVEQLPQDDTNPATTEGYDGFIHCYQMVGNVAAATLHLILRDFTREGLVEKGDFVKALCAKMQELEPRAEIHCDISKQYRNMAYWLEDDLRPVELAVEAAREAGLAPFHKPTRGGTDGSRLTEMGLPTPNIFTGMQNYHGPLEYVSLQDMAKATETCINLVQKWVD